MRTFFNQELFYQKFTKTYKPKYAAYIPDVTDRFVKYFSKNSTKTRQINKNPTEKKVSYDIGLLARIQISIEMN